MQIISSILLLDMMMTKYSIPMIQDGGLYYTLHMLQYTHKAIRSLIYVETVGDILIEMSEIANKLHNERKTQSKLLPSIVDCILEIITTVLSKSQHTSITLYDINFTLSHVIEQHINKNESKKS